MAQQKKGFITRLLEGKEKSEEYARSTLPTNRWQLFWDIFKGNFGKLVTVNLLTVLFFLPMIAVILICVMVSDTSGQVYPFGANVGIGYPAFPHCRGKRKIWRCKIISFCIWVFLLRPRRRQSGFRAVCTLSVIWYGRKVSSSQTTFGAA